MRFLLVEDDDSVASALCDALSAAGHDVERVDSGVDALLRHHDRDVVLLDLGLRDGDGFEVLRRLRQVTAAPVVVVTARSDERSTVRALRLGADDYVVKPIRLRELLARIDVVTRRHPGSEPQHGLVRAQGVTVDLSARSVSADDGTPIRLTAKEFAILASLARRPGTAVSRQQILDEVWGDAYAAASRSFDVHLTQVRAKLPPSVRITTIRGFGYRLEV
ncbi:MAG: response regulator transcription factor [Phycicoccus sp.]